MDDSRAESLDIPDMKHLRTMMAAMFPPKLQSAPIYRPDMPITSQPSLLLPLDVFGVIAECLASSYAYGTLSNLGLTCKVIRKETLPVLFELVLWDNDEFNGPSREWWYEGMKEKDGYTIPEGWKYISK